MTGLTKNVGTRDTSSVDYKLAIGNSGTSGSRKENSQLAATLQNYAETMLSEEMPQPAISLLTSALMVDPGRISLIHKIGQCLERCGNKDDAGCCYRGSLPDSINEQYFNSSELGKKVKPALACDSVEYLHAFGSEKIDLKPPVRNETGKQYRQFDYPATQARETFCTVANNGSIWFDGYNTLALDCEDHIIEEQLKGNEFPCYHAIKVTEARRLDGTVCFLDGRSSKIYYHWILDILPKLGVMEKAGIELAGIDYFLVTATSAFQLDTLRALGVREEQIIFDRNTFLYQADKLIVPCLRNDLGERIHYAMGVGLGSWIPAYLQSKFGPRRSERGDSQLPSDTAIDTASDTATDTMITDDPDKPVKVYISRSARGSRNIANEPDMIEALQSRGFTKVEFERLTVVQQAELMSRAEIVVGVHGAGFTNLTFCKPGTRVIEIFGDYIVPCYWALSAVAGLEYAQFMAKSVDETSNNSGTDSALETANPGQRVAVLRDMEIDIDVEAFIDYLDLTHGDTPPGDTTGDSFPGAVAGGSAVSA